MYALIEITDGSPPTMLDADTGIGAISIYDTVVRVLAHAEPENTSVEEWAVVDEHGTFFSIEPDGKWFSLKAVKNDPTLALRLMMKALSGL
jgi:hypothetical protein